MQYREKKGVVIARLFPGEDLFKTTAQILRELKIETAVVLSGIGMLKDFELSYFIGKGNYGTEKFGKAHELCALSGLICRKGEDDYSFHLHAVLADENKKAVAGHLPKGTVEVTCELALLKTDIGLKRRIEEESGLNGLFLE